MKRALFALLLTTTPALAQGQPVQTVPVPGPAGSNIGSNIGLAQYPASTCKKPVPVSADGKPTPPPERPTDMQALAYNKKVDAYNAQMRTFNEQSAAYGTCINTYIANGNADMRRIRDALDAALAAAK